MDANHKNQMVILQMRTIYTTGFLALPSGCSNESNERGSHFGIRSEKVDVIGPIGPLLLVFRSVLPSECMTVVRPCVRPCVPLLQNNAWMQQQVANAME